MTPLINLRVRYNASHESKERYEINCLHTSVPPLSNPMPIPYGHLLWQVTYGHWKIGWFKVINIAGLELTAQEIRNAVYSGPWVSDARRYFSKAGCGARS